MVKLWRWSFFLIKTLQLKDDILKNIIISPNEIISWRIWLHTLCLLSNYGVLNNLVQVKSHEKQRQLPWNFSSLKENLIINIMILRQFLLKCFNWWGLKQFQTVLKSFQIQTQEIKQNFHKSYYVLIQKEFLTIQNLKEIKKCCTTWSTYA